MQRHAGGMQGSCKETGSSSYLGRAHARAPTPGALRKAIRQNDVVTIQEQVGC